MRHLQILQNLALFDISQQHPKQCDRSNGTSQKSNSKGNHANFSGGSITLFPEEPEDMWCVLIGPLLSSPVASPFASALLFYFSCTDLTSMTGICITSLNQKTV